MTKHVDVFSVHSSNSVHLQNANAKFHKVAQRHYTVSKKLCKIFLSELRQISTDFDNFWQKDGSKEAEIMQSALIFRLTYFASPHYRVKRKCSKLLHNAVIIRIKLLTFAASVQ